MSKVNLSPPWEKYFNMLVAFFGCDEDVEIYKEPLNENKMIVNLYVKKKRKYDALNHILKKDVKIGNVSVVINILDMSREKEIKLEDAFEGNPFVEEVVKQEDPSGAVRTFVVIGCQLVQFFNDNLCDYRGNYSALGEDVARQLFEVEAGTYFCTAALDEDE